MLYGKKYRKDLNLVGEDFKIAIGADFCDRCLSKKMKSKNRYEAEDSLEGKIEHQIVFSIKKRGTEVILCKKCIKELYDEILKLESKAQEQTNENKDIQEETDKKNQEDKKENKKKIKK